MHENLYKINAAAPAVTADPVDRVKGIFIWGSCMDNGAPADRISAVACQSGTSCRAGGFTSSGLSIGDALTATAGLDASSNTSIRGQLTDRGVTHIRYHLRSTPTPNSSLDFDEIGLGDIVWAKLVQGGTSCRSSSPTRETGAYALSNIPNGTYAVIADNNALDNRCHADGARQLAVPEPARRPSVTGDRLTEGTSPARTSA